MSDASSAPTAATVKEAGESDVMKDSALRYMAYSARIARVVATPPLTIWLVAVPLPLETASQGGHSAGTCSEPDGGTKRRLVAGRTHGPPPQDRLETLVTWVKPASSGVPGTRMRYMAYSSEVGEALRPVVPARPQGLCRPSARGRPQGVPLRRLRRILRVLRRRRLRERSESESGGALRLGLSPVSVCQPIGINVDPSP